MPTTQKAAPTQQTTKPPRLQRKYDGTLEGTTRNGRYVVSTTQASVDRAWADMRLHLPNTPLDVVLDPDYWVRKYAAPGTVWTNVVDHGIEAVIVRR